MGKNEFIKGIYINREYSWLLFNKRVLEQAQDLTNPLLERCKFLAISNSNLDEFFMVRVGSLYNENLSEPDERENKTQLTAQKQLDVICATTKKYYTAKARVYRSLERELSSNGIKILRGKDLTARQREECGEIFTSRVLPLCALMALDAKHPMMKFENMRDYMLYDIEKDGRKMIGVMAVNPNLPKLYRIGKGEKVRLIPLVELVRQFGYMAFLGYTVNGSMMMRVTRNADFDTNIDDSDMEHDFTEIMKQRVESRAKMNVVRLEVDEDNCKLCDFVLKLLKLNKAFCFKDERFFNYKFLYDVGGFLEHDRAAKLKYPPFKGAVPSELLNSRSLIDYVFKKDIFLSYPYDSMSPLVDLLAECAEDKRVNSISITIYRLANHSRIADLLCKACENGKQVTVVIELCARFDEENNMFFASKLQEAGCTIIYGMGNYKVHSKIISIVLSDGGELKYITHIGTGNYNESTSKQYTDLNIITADKKFGEDACAFFRNIAICNADFKYQRLLVAPETLKPELIKLCDREIEKAKNGGEGYILAKMNSLTDKAIIDKLAEASKAGVKIRLVIRGICCMLPGVAEETVNIKIISIVGRFLEHSRVYSFGCGKDRKTYISSADLMTRNTDKRLEIAAPVLDSDIENKIIDILNLMFSDNVKARWLGNDGKYRRVESDGEQIDAQNTLLIIAS